MAEDVDPPEKRRSIPAPITNKRKGQRIRQSQKLFVQARREYEK